MRGFGGFISKSLDWKQGGVIFRDRESQPGSIPTSGQIVKIPQENWLNEKEKKGNFVKLFLNLIA